MRPLTPTARTLDRFRYGETLDPLDRRAVEQAEALVRRKLLTRTWDDGRPRYAATEAGMAVLREAAHG